MAIFEEQAGRELPKRKAIDEMLQKVSNLARENNEAALRLRTILVGALVPTQDQQPGRPTRPGWLGEIVDTLAVVIDHLVDTAKVLEEVSQQVATETPTSVARRQ